MMYLWLLVGFVLLIKGADFFVDGASAVARLLRVPSVVIGLTVAAIGTSLPEASVSITAGLAGNSDISISNVIGSNICNLLLVLGATACVRQVPCSREILRRDFPWSLFGAALVMIFVLDGVVARWEGGLLLLLLVGYLVYVVRCALQNRTAEETEEEPMPTWKAAALILVGAVAITWGGDLVVDNARNIALAWGMSDALVGCTIVAIGTSLPELVTSMVAAAKGDTDLAVGNVVGSCIFNLLFILGAAAALTPIRAEGYLISTLLLTAATGLTFLLCATKKQLNRAEGALLLCGYGAYMVYAILCV
jgi:cation:H+ antiporter